MEKLPEVFSKRGYTYELRLRNQQAAIYEQKLKTGATVCFEVFEILSHSGRWIGANYVPPKEFAPSDEQWGSKGWSIYDWDKARIKYDEITSNVINRAFISGI